MYNSWKTREKSGINTLLSETDSNVSDTFIGDKDLSFWALEAVYCK